MKIDCRRHIFGRPWAILPDELENIRAAVEHAQGGLFDPMPVVEQPEYELVNGVAVICVSGVLVRERSYFDALLGGVTAVDDIQSQFDAAMDSNASAIIFRFDSPGGQVSGIAEMGRRIFDARQTSDKPILAVGSGTVASAAYWLAVQCDSLTISEATQAGSIGVVAVVADRSRMLSNAGIDVTAFRSTPGKMALDAGLRDSDKRDIQSQVNKYHRLFVDAVARGRGITPADAAALADGTVSIGTDAVSKRLCDDIGTFEDVLSQH